MAVDWEYERRRNSKLHRLRRHAALAQPAIAAIHAIDPQQPVSDVRLMGDIVAGSLRDPFPFDAIDVPVHLFGGDADLNVGLEHLDWWAAGLSGAERRVLAETGHLLAVTHWAEILEAAR